MAIIAALYAVITILLAPISYGPLQVRVSEALTVLPFLTTTAIPGLFVGCLVANIYGGLGMQDIMFGSLATLIAAYLTWRMPKAYLAPLPPVIVNAVIVAAYLSGLAGLPYWLTALYIALGELVACYLLGYPLLLLIQRNKALMGYLRS